MTPQINWQVAQARSDEIRRLEASTDAHPFARFVYLVFGPTKAHR